jgi:hypothetical protein
VRGDHRHQDWPLAWTQGPGKPRLTAQHCEQWVNFPFTQKVIDGLAIRELGVNCCADLILYNFC